jgi:hypothetical protein
MRRARIVWNSIIAAIVVSVVLYLTPCQVHAWTYRDDFNSTKAEQDSYLHSIFWPQGAFPPSEPYLYHSNTGQQSELGFGDYNGEAAVLGYCFPVGSAKSHSAVSGYMSIDIRFQDTTDLVSGSLQYSLSDDGVIWSSAQYLGQGSHTISLESVSGVCYIKFRGTEVLIDDLEVFLDSSPAAIEVPRDFSTIQDAIDSASYGDIVEVSPGTYRGDGNWDIDFKGKAIILRSSSGSGQTIIDCSGSEGHRGFYFHGGENRNSVLRGFTIRGAILTGSDIPPENASWNPSPSHPIGGGIYCENSSPSIVECVIQHCSAELGGGIGSVGGSPLIIDCTIEQCQAGGFGQAQSGGYGAGIGVIKGSDARIVNCIIERNIGYNKSLGAGVYCWQSRLMLAGCDVSFNSAQENVKGGGIYCGGSSAQATLEHCIVSNNTAEAGGGIFSNSYARTNITNCTIADNSLSASQSSGGGVYADTSYISIRNSIIWSNDGYAVLLNGSLSSNPIVYSDIEGGYFGQGNINSAPMFVSRGSDYHLQSYWNTGSSSNHSPCIDAGDPQDPIGAEPFPNNKRINMGAYGGTREASKSIGPLIFHVNGSNGNDYNSGLSRDRAFRTIGKAVYEAYDGDTIMVWPGTYREAVYVIGKAITIQSADDAAVVMAPSNDPIAFTFQFAESSMSVLRNFVITNCSETAVFCDGASPELTNLTIVNNQFGITAYAGSDPSINNCILWNNQFGDLEQCRARYSCLGALQPGDSSLGNISKDPIFADMNNGNYHLQSEYGRYLPKSGTWMADPQTSPCIDKGDPAMYIGREQKPHGGRVNMGAYGGTPFASKSGPSW